MGDGEYTFRDLFEMFWSQDHQADIGVRLPILGISAGLAALDPFSGIFGVAMSMALSTLGMQNFNGGRKLAHATVGAQGSAPSFPIFTETQPR
jgi:hypothetical protein